MAGRTDSHATDSTDPTTGRRKLGALLMLFGLISTFLAFVALPAEAVNVGSDPSGNLTGFEIEGNQVLNNAGKLDWANATGKVIVVDDTLDSGLQGTSKENDPSGWVCNTGGANPSKTNILAAAVNTRLTQSAVFLDMAYARDAGNGSAHVNFEFNQGEISGVCPNTGRQTGDLLLLMDFPGNGSDSGIPAIQAFEWDDSITADGQWVANNAIPATVGAGAENDGNLADTLFGLGTLADREFGEFSIDLLEALDIDPTSGECRSFGTLQVRSRSAGSSIESALQDTLAPTPIDLSTCGSITIHKQDDAGNALAGATFGLYDSQADAAARDDEIDTCVSAANGNCVFEEVPPGDYFVAEISAPAGYDPDPDVVAVTVGFRQAVNVAAPFVDPRQTGFVKITKTLVDDEGNPLTPDSLADLNGATFVLRQNGVVASLWPTPPSNDPATCTISNSQGFCIIGPVPIGSYEVLETVAPPGTTPGTQPGNVTVTKGNSAAAVTVSYPNVSETPTIAIAKTATPTEVLEPGGVVVFDIVITNTSTTETLVLDSLSDDVFGNLFAADATSTCDELAGDSLAPGAQVSCQLTRQIDGNAGDPDHHNTVTVVGTDDEGQQATDSDDATVGFDELGSIEVTKEADPTSVPEPGDDVTFTVTILNTSTERTVTIDTIVDDVFGDLGDAANGAVSSNTCADLIGDQLAPGGSTSCTFVAFIGDDAVPGDNAEHDNTVEVTGTDDLGNGVDDDDDATVDITDVLPTVEVTKDASDGSIPENTATPIDFTVTVTNTSPEPVEITSLSDDVFGAQAGDDDCQVGTILAAGASCSFTFTEVLTGDASGPDHTNTFTVVVKDDEGNTDDDDDPETVVFEDVPPTVEVLKGAVPGEIPENTPTDVEFTVTVTNTSDEAVTITSLTDSVFGDLDGDDDCQVGTELAPDESCTFTFTEELTGDAGADHSNTVTVIVTDDDGSTGQADDPETVVYTDVPPSVEVTKDSDTESIQDGAVAEVTFTVVVTNGSAEAVTITSLTDSVFGDLVGDDDCQVGTVLAVGGSCTFEFTETINGDIDAPHSNVVTVVVIDDEGTEGTDDDDEDIGVSPTTTTSTSTTIASTTTTAEVLGVQQTRELPRTGAQSLRIVLGGVGLLSLGIGFVLVSMYAQQQRRRWEF